MLFFSQIRLFEDYCGLGKYQGDTLACLYVLVSFSNTEEGWSCKPIT